VKNSDEKVNNESSESNKKMQRQNSDENK